MSEQGSPAPSGTGPISAREAAAIIATPPKQPEAETTDYNALKGVKENTGAEARETAAEPEHESADEADAGPAEERVPGETEEPDPAAEEQPSIEPPRSWSKEHKEAFAALPRHLQQAVAESERAREADFSQKARAAAEQQKALNAEKQAAEQARQQYEQALPALLLQVNTEYQREFGNPSWDEVQEWSRTDQDRYLRWQAAYQRSQALGAELAATQERKQTEVGRNRESYIAEQARLLAEKAPEYADEKLAPQQRAAAYSFMEEAGFSRDELREHLNNFVPMTLHDHRLQLIIRDAMRYREAERATKKAPPKQVPPVQRPGAKPDKADARDARLKDLGSQLQRSGKARDAAKLIAALGR